MTYTTYMPYTTYNPLSAACGMRHGHKKTGDSMTRFPCKKS